MQHENGTHNSADARRLDRRAFLAATGAAGVFSAAATTVWCDDEKPPKFAPGEVIDCHVHVKHGDAARTEWSGDQIVAMLDAASIGRAIVFAMSTTTAHSIELAKAAVSAHPRRLIPFLYALPSYERPALREIEHAIANDGFRGIKMHAGECPLLEYIVDPVIRLASSYPVPCLIDCAGDATVAARLAKDFPQTTLIYAHMGRYMESNPKVVDSFIKVAEQFDNVYLDLSAVALAHKIEEAAGRIGARRLMWGTDGPYKNPDIVSYARNELAKIRELKLSDDDKQQILGGTVARLLNL